MTVLLSRERGALMIYKIDPLCVLLLSLNLIETLIAPPDHEHDLLTYIELVWSRRVKRQELYVKDEGPIRHPRTGRLLTIG